MDRQNRKINREAIKACIQIQQSLDRIIEMHGLKKDFVIENSGIKRSTFFNKQKKKSFTLQELDTIAEIINR